MSAVSISENQETIFTVLRHEVNRLPSYVLAITAMLSGLVGFVAVLWNVGSWVILGVCYVVWCLATWGLYFRNRIVNSLFLRALKFSMVWSAAIVTIAVLINFYFAALGPKWVL